MGLKVIELLVDDSLTGETRVEEIALVLQPAIETEFVFFNKQKFQESYSDYPESVKNNALKAVKWAEENGWGSCGTNVGKQRASQLSKGEPISLETIQRMYSYLSRHKVDLETSKTYEDGCGLLMYDAWGGTDALDWSERKLKQVEENMGYDLGSLTPWSQTSGTTELAEVGERGAIVESKKAPKSSTPNPNPEGEGTARGTASGKRGAKVSEEQEKTLQKKVDDFNERESNIKNGKATLGALKSVFQRGLGAYNVSHSPSVQSAEQWAYARVNAFLYLLKNGRPENPKYQSDNDLLPNDHPKSKEQMSIDGDGCGCGCWDDGTYPFPTDTMYFENIMINGLPVFETIEEAEQYADEMGCEGTHVHTIDGKEYYMPCEIHPESMCGCGYNDKSIEEVPYYFSEYTEEEYEAAKLLKYLKDTDYQKFEAVVAGMNGATEQEVYARNHRSATPYFRYDRILTGSPDRDFCTSIEGRYFRRLEIDLLRDTNRDFGHNKEPYSKWLYKGGPNCVHAWRKFLFQGRNKVDEGMAQGLAGTPPKSMPNNGYYSEETKKKSEKAYAISQSQQMSRQSSSVIIVDVDDTLLRGGAAIEKTKSYINKKWENHKIVVVSGRQKSDEGQTRRQLERAGIKFDEIYLSDFPVGPNASRAFKEYKVKDLLSRGYSIVEAIDDDSNTRRDYTKLGVKSISPNSVGEFVKQEFRLDGEKRMVYSPAMKPGILIPRIDEATRERYFVTFRPETIEKMAQRYMIDKRSGGGHTNYEHSDLKFEDVYLVESWIVDGEQDKAYSLGYTKEQVPSGTWMVGFRIDSDEVWQMIKDGEIKGISIEGNFEYSFKKEDNFTSSTSDEYLLKEIINIINQIK